MIIVVTMYIACVKSKSGNVFYDSIMKDRSNARTTQGSDYGSMLYSRKPHDKYLYGCPKSWFGKHYYYCYTSCGSVGVEDLHDITFLHTLLK